MKKEQTVEITIEEYKELLETKGKYEELKLHPEIKFIYVYNPPKTIETYPTVTWSYLDNKVE